MKLKIVAALVTATLCAPFHLAIGQTQATTGPQQISWNLAPLYASDDVWREQIPVLRANLDELKALKGTLGSARGLLHAQTKIFDHYRHLLRVYTYASLKSDEDVRDASNLEMKSLAGSLYAQTQQATSWFNPELIALGTEKVRSFIKQEPELEQYRKPLHDVLRMEDYTLNADAERVIALAGEPLSGASMSYNILSNATIDYPVVEIDGDQKKINASGYVTHRASKDRQTRKQVFDAYWQTWKDHEALTGSLLATHVNSHVFTAKARNFDNTLQSAVYRSNIPTTVYERLLTETNKHLPKFHRYLKLRQRMLGLPDLHYYDSYVTTSKSARQFSWEEAKQLTLQSLKPFGKEYLGLMEQVLNSDKIHVYPEEGKQSGAYVQGSAYDVSPYMLMNFDGSFDEVSTLAHEAGHFVHSLLSKQHNPFATYFYSTFTAELASTTNEVLLQEYMFKQDLSDEERLFYIDRALGGIRGTFFRQAQFAEFEREMHKLAEQGEPLSGKKLSQLYLDIVRRYYGHNEGIMQVADNIGAEWMMISHFYTNYYVYQYATSITGGTAFAERMRNGDEQAANDYLNVLKAGGSEYPYQLLAQNGIDLAEPEPYNILMTRFERLMDEAEEILDRMEK